MTVREFLEILRSMTTDFRSIVTRMRRRLGLGDDQSGITGTK
jgi:hypothetical protein